MYIKENLPIKLFKPKYSIFSHFISLENTHFLQKQSTQNQEKMEENTYNNINQEEFEETLSFCDLSFENQELDRSLSFHHSPNSPSHELFQFPFIPNTHLNNKNDIIFCGKLIKEQTFDADDDDQSRYLFPLSSARQLNYNKKDLGSLYLVNSKPKSSLPTKSLRSQSFSSSRKPKVLIGLSKIPPKMELSDIKKRQSRRNPSPMFPPVATCDLEAMESGDGCGAGGRKRGHHWSLLRSFRCSAYLASALAKASLGCIPRL